MSLQQWADNSWLVQIQPSPVEVRNLLGMAKRDITDASNKGISPDNRFNMAYDAVRALCEVPLHATGYIVPKGESAHQRTIDSLQYTLGNAWEKEARFFDRCRRMRHKTKYERSGSVQQSDVDDLLDSAKKLEAGVLTWLKGNHPDLLLLP